MRIVGWLLMALFLASPAGALLLDEEDANDQAATTPTTLSVVEGDLRFDAGILALEPGDVDWIFLGSLAAGDVVTATTTPLDDTVFEEPDTLLGLFDGEGSLVAFSDDASNEEFTFDGLGSLIRYLVSDAGEYWLVVSGFGDDVAFDGSHTETGSYLLQVSVAPIPEPGTWLLVLGGTVGLALAGRRRG